MTSPSPAFDAVPAITAPAADEQIDATTTAAPPCRNCPPLPKKLPDVTPSHAGDVHLRPPPAPAELDKDLSSRSEYFVHGRFAPIMPPFASAMAKCAPACSYSSWGVWVDKAHKLRRSCHNSGSAIDITALTCAGQTYDSDHKKFREFLDCFRNPGQLSVIFGRGSHRRHAHVSTTICEQRGQGKIFGGSQ
jgi:hypothetical protein